MLLDDVAQTIGVASDSLRAATEKPDDKWFVDAVGCSAVEKDEIRKLILSSEPGAVDPVVQFVLAATNGILYKPLLGKLKEYPIPEIRLPASDGEPLLDIGCNWGRWCIAAARKGYRVTGIDPSLGSVLAAKRASSALGVRPNFVVGDARYLPFKADTFARVFSYSVLQHLSKEDVILVLKHITRVLHPGGQSLIQMANALGIRSLQHQVSRGFRPAKNFEVRYWTPGELRRQFGRHIGKTRLSVDGYFGLGIQVSDVQVMPPTYRTIVRASESLRALSKWTPIVWAADSLYVSSRRK